MLHNDLIIDVGMHKGQDTEFYLRKGFRVAAVEANPILVQQVRARLAGYLASGQLTLFDVAVSDHDGTVTFYHNQQKDDWGTTRAASVAGEGRLGTTHVSFEVPAKRFEQMLSVVGVPYYLKLDIEGAERLCLDALIHEQARPVYVSAEIGATFEPAFDTLAALWMLGYRRFKVLNQALNFRLKPPQPPREGRYVEQRFDGYSSGLFGAETPGRWLDVSETVARLQAIDRLSRRAGFRRTWASRVYRRLYNQARQLIGREPFGWYDLHAWLGDPA